MILSKDVVLDGAKDTRGEAFYKDEAEIGALNLCVVRGASELGDQFGDTGAIGSDGFGL